MYPLSPKINRPPQQHNFKVRINYLNAPVTIQSSGRLAPSIPVYFSHNIVPVNYQSQPSISNLIDFNRMPNSPSFSISTASQSQLVDLCDSRVKKIEGSKFTFNPEILSHNQTIKNSTPQIKSQLPKINELDCQIESDPPIQCVICERKFESKDFDYHIQLHKEKKNQKTFPISSSPVSKLESPLINYRDEDKQQINKWSNQFSNEINPEMLYSFENKNHPRISLNQSAERFQNLSKSTNLKYAKGTQIMSQNSSSPQSLRSSTSSMNKVTQPILKIPITVIQPTILNNVQVAQLPTGIRYINPTSTINPVLNTSFASSHKSIQNNDAVFIQQRPIISNQRDLSRSMRSSQSLNSAEKRSLRSLKNSQLQNQIFNQIQQTSIPNASQPVKNIEERVITAEQKNKLTFRNKVKLSKTRKNEQNDSMFLSKDKRKELNQVRSQCSQHSQSSITSIRSMKLPLESTNKEQMMKVCKKSKKRIDLSNIIGLSEALAKGSGNSNFSIKNPNESLNNKIKHSLSNKKQKSMMANSMIMHQASNSSKKPNILRNTISGSQNLQLIAIRNRQIYRGTQVSEQQLLEYDSKLNASRTSKSSTKTKLPRNYLAINDFISNNSAQSKI